MSLKELKNRLQSVQSTLKITSAMRMISSAKMRKAQQVLLKREVYKKGLSNTLFALFSKERGLNKNQIPWLEKREVKKRAVVVMASDGSLCGAYNHTIIKEFQVYYAQNAAIISTIFPIGGKMEEALKRQGIPFEHPMGVKMGLSLGESVMQFAARLEEMFLQKEVDEILLFYMKAPSLSQQEIQKEVLLPFSPESEWPEAQASKSSLGYNNYFLFEPSAEEIASELLKKHFYFNLSLAILHSYIAEQSARTMAMQTATDNASDLIDELKIQYNKMRQNAITAELLDMVGASM